MTFTVIGYVTHDHRAMGDALLNGSGEAVYHFQLLSSLKCCTGKIVTFTENIMIHPHTVKTVRMTFSFHKHHPAERLGICMLPSPRNKHRFWLYLFRYFWFKPVIWNQTTGDRARVLQAAPSFFNLSHFKMALLWGNWLKISFYKNVSTFISSFSPLNYSSAGSRLVASSN